MSDTVDDLPPVAVSDALGRVLDAHPLAEGMIDADMTMSDVAAALGVSVNRMAQIAANCVPASEWVGDDQFPAVEVGGQGKRYVIRLSHAWAVRRLRESQDEARDRRSQAAINAAQAVFLGIDPEENGAVLDPKTRRAMAEADILHSRAAVMRRRLVELEEVQDVLESVFRIVRDGIESMPDRLERELGLKPEQISLVIRLGDDMLTAMIEKIEEAELKERDIADVEIPDRLVV